MSDRKLDRLFVRFRRRGDPTAMAELFDRTAPELLRLAMHLVRDPVEAEDVVQATFLAAIEGAASFDASRRVMPWLVGILTRQAGLARRRARREVEPDRLHERNVEDPADDAAAHEFSAELVVALQGLPEKYREVLWLHLADGQRPAEIAARLQRAPGTVRMQMHRGLELLRRALPAGFAASAAGAGVGLALLGRTRGLAAMRAEVVAAAARQAPVLLASAPASVGILGSWSVAAQALVVAGGLAAAAGLGWLVNERAAETPRTARPTTNDARLDTARKQVVASTNDERQELGTAPPLVQASATVQGIVLRGRVLGLASGETLETRLGVRAVARFPWPPELEVVGRPEEDGRFALDVSALFDPGLRPDQPREELVLAVDHPRRLHAEARVRVRPDLRQYTLDVELEPAAVLRGRALSDELSVLPGTRVAAWRLVGGLPVEPALDVATCDERGDFALRVGVPGEHLVAALNEGRRPASLAVRVDAAAPLWIDPLALGPGESIAGTALRLGLPLDAGARIEAHITGALDEASARITLGGEPLLYVDGALERARAQAITQADGTFLLTGLGQRAYRVLVAPPGARSPGEVLAPHVAGVLLHAPTAGIVLESAVAMLHIEVVSDAGPTDWPGLPVALVRQGDDERSVRLDAQGRGAIEIRPGEPCDVRVVAQGRLPAAMRWEAPAPGEESTRTLALAPDPDLATAVFALALQGAARLPERVSFQFEPRQPDASSPPGFVRHVVRSDASFVVSGLPPGAWHVSVNVGGVYRHYYDLWRETRVALDLEPRETHTLSVAIERGARLRLAARDPGGRRLRAECVVRDARGERLAVKFMARRPETTHTDELELSELFDSDVFPNLAPGTYSLELHAAGYLPRSVTVELAAGEHVELAPELTPEVPPR
jgi:RNA polymerase sigma-70 factor (ECF subfamily)